MAKSITEQRVLCTKWILLLVVIVHCLGVKGHLCRTITIDNKEIVSCVNQSLTEIPTDLSQDISQLYLTHNNITTIGNGSFVYYPQLTYLNLEYNQIEKVEQCNFNGLPNLQILNVMENRISYIQDGSFTNVSKLSELYFDNCYIPILTFSIFRGLSELRVLRMTNCGIEHFQTNVFQDLIALEYLDLSGNRFRFLPPDFPIHLSALRGINVNDNILSTFPAYICKFAPDIKYLSIRGSHLSSLHLWPCCPSLKMERFKFHKCLNNNFKVMKTSYTEKQAVIDDMVTCELETRTPRYVIDFPTVKGEVKYSNDCPDYVKIHAIIAVSIIVFVGFVCFLIYCVIHVIVSACCTSNDGLKKRLLEEKEKSDNLEHDYTYDVTIICADKDNEWTEKHISQPLDERYEMSVFKKEREHISGFESDAVISAIVNSNKTLFILSKDFMKNEKCQYEFELALRERDMNRNVVILVSREDVRGHAETRLLPDYMSGRHKKYPKAGKPTDEEKFFTWLVKEIKRPCKQNKQKKPKRVKCVCKKKTCICILNCSAGLDGSPGSSYSNISSTC